jgi:predicted DNA-binding transcriptional regulator AlpA
MATQDCDTNAAEIALLRPDEAAARIGVTTRALDKMRQRRTGPPWIKMTARAVRYPSDALEAWIAQRIQAYRARASRRGRAADREASGCS